ncbi:acyl-CoA dehydrogenase family protein [Paenibacillus sp. MBLB4367]|uniref:acyl-CoA dehydrogenase family protein n=1 Tax=Paenibacillus sp. MBLB4367 TaxID=3384767 RepID=UPI003908266A
MRDKKSGHTDQEDTRSGSGQVVQQEQQEQQEQRRHTLRASRISRNGAKRERLSSLMDKIGELAGRFAERASQHDREGTFPYENIADLREAGYLALTVPSRYGGMGASLYELVVLQERLARGDGATALSLGWHLTAIMELDVRRSWKEDTFAELCKDVVEAGSLVNKLATEPATGSPARGGRPQTTAKRTEDGWLLNGRKTFATMGTALDYLIVSAGIEGEEGIGEFLLRKDTPGICFVPTWDTLGMRGTRSDDLYLEDVRVPEEALVQLLNKKTGYKSLGGWYLHIPACYLGIAQAARDYAVEFAAAYSTNSTNGPIRHLPNVRQLVGRIDLELLTARHLVHAVAKRWDAEPEARNELGTELAAAKHVATNTAVSVVDMAMRVVGGHSLFRSSPLERYYRDVRAGLHNPPADEITLGMLANKAFEAYDD